MKHRAFVILAAAALAFGPYAAHPASAAEPETSAEKEAPAVT